MMADPNDPSRLTKQQAAAALRVSTKTIEQWVKEGKLDPRRWRAPTGGQWRVVFLAEDVAKLAAEVQGGPAVPFVVRAPARASNGNGHHGAIALQRQPSDLPSGEDILRLVFAMAQRALLADPLLEAEKGAKAEKKPVLTLQEASAETGWSRTFLLRKIHNGALKAEKDRGWKIRRTDLEQL